MRRYEPRSKLCASGGTLESKNRRCDRLIALLGTAARSACLAPGGRGQQSLQRALLQSNGIALALHRDAQHGARELVRFHGLLPTDLSVSHASSKAVSKTTKV